MSPRRGNRSPAPHLLVHLALIVTCALTLVPIVYTLTISISSSNTLVSSSYSFMPRRPTLANYRAILVEHSFLLWMKNSMLLSASSTLVALAVAAPAAYAYSRFSFRYRSVSLYTLLLLNGFPALLSMVALYRLYLTLGLMNTYGGVILVYAGSVTIFSTWNLKGYFDTIPVEIEQAARIDGAGNLGILWRILLPLARPAIVVTGTMAFITSWNEYVYALNFLTTDEHITLAAGLYMLQGTAYHTNWPRFAAGSLMVTLPVLAVFFAAQRHMISGLTMGGVKY